MSKLPRSYWYALAILVPVLAVIWVSSHTWRELRHLHRNFAAVQAEDIYIPAHIALTVQQLNDAVLRFDLRQDPSDRTIFEVTSQELGRYIQQHQSRLTTKQQIQLLDQIEQAYYIYLRHSQELMAKTNQVLQPAAIEPTLMRVEENSTALLGLCELLKQSEQVEQDKFLQDSQQALAWIQQLLLVVLVVLLIMIGTAAIAIFRGVVGPLRVELSRSRVLAVRNEKLAALGTLAAGVAHEIRNPLTAINVRLHSLKKNLTENSSEQEDALVIGHEIQRLESIVQEFLQFARPAEPKLVVVSADSLLGKVQSLFHTQLAKAGIQLQTETIPDIWVRADPRQMEQVLINLIKNAAESIGHTGSITLKARTETARLNGQNRPVVVLEIIDTGKGIPPEVQQHIFDPFFTTKEEGTGLGLVIASRIIEKHGGTLECHSTPNRGTTFAIRLPQVTSEQMHEPSS